MSNLEKKDTEKGTDLISNEGAVYVMPEAFKKNIIKKTDKMSAVKEILKSHCIETPYGWEIPMCMLLSSCDYVEVHGYGEKAYFVQVR